MDEFSKLSIVDNGSVVREEDLDAILELKIADNGADPLDGKKRQISQKLIEKLMPHVPSSPSPLRQSVFIDDSYDEMEVDSFEEEGDLQKQALDDDLLVESDCDENNPKTSTTNSRTVIKALLSPTSLGVAAATKLDALPDPTSVSGGPSVANSSISEPQPHHTAEKVASTGFDLSPQSLDELRQRAQHQPIQISINNNHFYYPPTELHQSESRNHSFAQNDYYQLPNPWSSNSRPASRGTYNLASYLQIFLNGMTVLVLFSFVLIFMRSLKTDIRSAWQYAKLELDQESARCQVQYTLNHCDRSTRVEAMETQCDLWESCMARNNDLFFRARTAISAKLIGDVVNAFVEPLGWKTLGVILSGLAIWCFSSNFILGFARAKSYYGDHLSHSLMRRDQLNDKAGINRPHRSDEDLLE
ncbi:LADA_0E06964g1_1 [Lachancea dasiensis]|uniref:LADA_0E06964g1_1 n=1 Tax=Lachancea dasiensis TaxID=1072105 RepID=A0A1G4JD05_9SACH|nr:LADA_0E06964g1_1 [Lachancea dasiensis]